MTSELKALIKIIVSDVDLHARWLNTFSYLEYMGFRKIVKSQHGDALTRGTLTHMMEEGRHALLLKRMAIKIGGAAFDSYGKEALLCGHEAKAYFNELEHACEHTFRGERTPSRYAYLYLTWLVEVRAIEVYTAYQEALAELGRASTLRGLLAEENHHLKAVVSELRSIDPHFEIRGRNLQKTEAALYHAYVGALSTNLNLAIA